MTSINRREFLGQSTSCAAYLALAASAMPLSARRAWARTTSAALVRREPWGSLERVADGVWAMVSTPLGGDSTTVSNGGIIAGKNGVLAIEAFNKPAGAQWLAAQCRELTGRLPTHVALTHYHSDHANGLSGYVSDGASPIVHSTGRTRELVVERNKPTEITLTTINKAIAIDPAKPSTIDLGGKVVHVVPRDGHTESDVSLEIEDPSIVFCGDLFWNAMFPNFVDAIPTKLNASVRALKRSKETLYVPGHGPLGHQPEYDRYIAMLGEVERAAKQAHAAGTSATDAGSAFVMPASLGEWALFNKASKAFYQRAFEAWYKELKS
jgi:glyoxylase-like metal-dependent hydrolase (beta-lactamase superfamily II)